MTALGIALLVIGAVAVMAEAHVSSLGVLAGPGVIALAVGSLLAVSGLGGGIALAVVMAFVLAGTGVGITTVSWRKAMAARRRRIRTGSEGLIGRLGVVRTWSEPTGMVLVDGALWRARLCWPVDDEPPSELHTGDPVVVERLDGLTLTVRRAEDWELVA